MDPVFSKSKFKLKKDLSSQGYNSDDDNSAFWSIRTQFNFNYGFNTVVVFKGIFT